jgi:hypothetical protein
MQNKQMRTVSYLKRVSLLLIMAVTCFGTSFAQTGEYSYQKKWGKTGLQLSEQKSNAITLNYSIGDFSIYSEKINGNDAHLISIGSYFLPNNEGNPNLPGKGHYLAIPNGAIATLEILEMETDIIANVDMAPAPQIPLENDDENLYYSKNEVVYETNAFYPEKPVIISEQQTIRGVNTVLLGITPYQYNPVTKELKVITNLKLEVKYNGGDGTYGETRLRNRWWDPILKDAIFNSDVLPIVDFNKRDLKAPKDNEEYEYLIISPNGEDYLAWADSIRVFRNMQGIKTGIVTLEEIGGNNINLIEDYIDNIYNSWSVPPAAILMLGDYGDDADRHIIAPIYDNYCASDNIYADVNNDHLPDIIFARITANNEQQLSVMVRKFIEYEKNPPQSEYFYQHPITALGWQTERWFQICSESVGGFWKNVLGKDPVRINAVYAGNPDVDPWSYAPNTNTVLNYFGPDGLGYLPETPGELGGFNGGSTWDVINAINNGAFMLQHRDHGNESGWGEPAFNSNSINHLTNTDLTYIFSINCLTGKYNYGGEVFAEKFHRRTWNDQLTGALGILAASEVSYSFVNDTYVWGIYDYMWPEFLPDYGGDYPEIRNVLPAFASVYGKYYLRQSGWPYNTGNKRVTYHLFHHHGDAFLNVYTEVPQNLDITHEDVMVTGTVTNFEITADEGSLIALSIDGELLATGQGTGSPITIQTEYIVPGTIVDVVVTKQNYFRYHSEVLVIPPDGPYVIEDAFTINDSEGNTNGVADFKELVQLSIAMENVGNELAENVEVTLISDNSFVTLNDESDIYGDINASEVIENPNGFALQIANNIPDQTQVNFDVEAISGDETWVSYINFVVNAPVLVIDRYFAVETEGNGNGILDPGERGTITFEFQNNGHAIATELISELQFGDNRISIVEDSKAIESIDINGMTQLSFDVETSNTIPVGEDISMICTLSDGGYFIEREFVLELGKDFEDWETGDLTAFDWSCIGSDWTICEDVVYEGTYSLKSGQYEGAGYSILDLSLTTLVDDSISFFRKVSSQENYDLLRFYVDENEVDSWSGEKDWERVSYFIPAGDHNFKWVYTKDGTVNNGEDCGWIDFIVFPQLQKTDGWAGLDFESCEGDNIELNGRASYYESLHWESSGNGSFNDNSLLNPSYTPSQEDINNGSVDFTLFVNGTEGASYEYDVQVSFNRLPETSTIIEELTEVDLNDGLSTELTCTEIFNASEYQWTIAPEEAGTIEFNDTQLTINWNEEFTGDVIISVQSMNFCGVAEADTKTINVKNTVGLNDETGSMISLYPNPAEDFVKLIFNSDNEEDVMLSITDINGRVIKRKDFSDSVINEIIDLEGMAAGSYTIQIITGENTYTEKLIVK